MIATICAAGAFSGCDEFCQLGAPVVLKRDRVVENDVRQNAHVREHQGKLIQDLEVGGLPGNAPEALCDDVARAGDRYHDCQTRTDTPFERGRKP
jgi:hypothetical protein